MSLIDHRFIVFGTYSGNTLGQIRSLGEKGIKPTAVLVHKNLYRIDKSKYIGEKYDAKDIESGLALIIEKFGDEAHKPFIYTDRDDIMSLLDNRYDELKDRFYIWNAGGQGRLNPYLNKNEQLKLAVRCGLPTPKTEIVKVGEMPKKLTYPIFTKAVDSLSFWWKGQASVCMDEKELQAVYQKIDAKELVLQEYVDKSDETPIEGLSIRGGEEIVLFCQTGNYRMPRDAYGTYRHIECFEDKETEAKIQKFIKEVGYTGIFDVDFIVDKRGKTLFLEVNFRIGEPNHAFTLYGANIPFIYARAVLEGRIPTDEIHFISKRPFKLMYELDDFKFAVMGKRVSLCQWLKEAKNSDCYLFYDKHDKRPFFYTLLDKALYQLKKPFVKKKY